MKAICCMLNPRLCGPLQAAIAAPRLISMSTGSFLACEPVVAGTYAPAKRASEVVAPAYAAATVGFAGTYFFLFCRGRSPRRASTSCRLGAP